jgi:Domain of unknown function (DUF4190)
MSMPAQLDARASNKPPLPSGLLIATILVILQIVARAGFLATTLVRSSRFFLDNPIFLILAVIVPALLLIMTIVMVALIFARTPAAKPYGITVCILSLAWQIYSIIRLISLYASHPNISVSPIAITVSIAYIAIFTLALIFLIRWRVGEAVPPPLLAATTETSHPAVMTQTSHRGLAQASLICALCGPLAMIILGPVALGLGIAARTKMSKSKNFDGAGMALAGIIIGAIETVLSVGLVGLAIVMQF